MEILRLLYTSERKKALTEPLILTETKQKRLKALKAALILAPVLEIADILKPCHLFVHETKYITKRF